MNQKKRGFNWAHHSHESWHKRPKDHMGLRLEIWSSRRIEARWYHWQADV